MLTPDPSGGVPRPAPSLVGAVMAGKYRLRRVIGHGGMGTVYKAENMAIGRTVALKLLHGHLSDDGVTVARFQREARAAASVAHDHIIEILDMGVEPSGAPFIVMEYVRGKSLAEVLREEGRFVPERAAHVAGQVLSALAAAHRAGIIHRDLKPENVLLAPRGTRRDYVKLFDFGIAAFVDAAYEPGGDDLTPTGRAMGTPTHTSPEQLLGRRVRDPRIDLYAVGVLLFEMMTGRPPFSGAPFPDLCRAILRTPPPRFASLGVTVAPDLEAVVRRALSKEPAHRHPSAEAMGEALVPFGAEPIVAEADPTDTLALELRELRARELLLGPSQRSHPVLGASGRETSEGIAELLEQLLGRERLHALRASDPWLAGVLRAGSDPASEGGLLGIVERVDRAHGRGDRRMVVQLGRQLARRAFADRDRDLLLRTLTPELFFSLLPELWARYFAQGDARVVNVGRGYGRLEIADVQGASLARSACVAGYVHEGLRMAGARDADVRLASTVALGDAMDVFEVTWSS